ncbi:MAG: thioredoxin domain-containing protein [Cyanobacteria bacterium]|nr:thioredoxin domain-containing protein [Cyanobacteriota bacterium]MDA1020397.1 thioredoxin domain-containing protein [Cyanobacteriota bacterium]
MRKLSVLTLLAFLVTGCNQTSETSSSNVSAVSEFLASSSKPAVLKFYASWCSSCKQYAPAFEEVKLSMGDKVDFFEIDVDESKYKGMVKELKISRIPETAFVNTERNRISKILGPIRVSQLEKHVTELLIQ